MYDMDQLSLEVFQICQDLFYSFQAPANFENCASQYLKEKYNLNEKEIRDILIHVIINYDQIKNQARPSRMELLIWRPK